MVLQFLQRLLMRSRLHLEERVSTVSNLLKQLFEFIIYICTIGWLAIFLYATFYYYYVPVVANVFPVHFQFRVCEDGVGICSFPTYNLTLMKEDSDEVFMPGQAYKIMLELEAPESPVNRNLGMFMVQLGLYNRKGETVITSSRTGTMRYSSELLCVIETLVFSPFLVFGYMNQKQIIGVELFSSYVDNSFDPVVGAVVEIQSKRVQIYAAWLKIYAEFTGIRYFLYYWPVTSAVIGFCWNFTLISFIVLLSWYNWDSGGDSLLKRPIKIAGGPNIIPVGVPETLGGGEEEEEDTVLMTPVVTEERGLRLRQVQSDETT